MKIAILWGLVGGKPVQAIPIDRQLICGNSFVFRELDTPQLELLMCGNNSNCRSLDSILVPTLTCGSIGNKRLIQAN